VSDVTIQNLPVDALEEAENNPNVMAPADFETLCRAMKEKGNLQPILVRQVAEQRFKVIDGHHRLRAAKACGMVAVASVITVCTDEEEVILRLAMNRLRGEVDLTAAGHIMLELQAAGVGLEEMKLTGFSESEMADLMAAVSQNVDETVKMSIAPRDDYEVDEDVGAVKPLLLEISFGSKADLRKAKKGLKHAAGDSGDMAVGLLRLLDGERTKEVA
jgi:ParB/RepB/Spo0J family partition protein